MSDKPELRHKPKASVCNGCGKERDPSELKRTQGGYICKACMKENEMWADYMSGSDHR